MMGVGRSKKLEEPFPRNTLLHGKKLEGASPEDSRLNMISGILLRKSPMKQLIDIKIRKDLEGFFYPYSHYMKHESPRS